MQSVYESSPYTAPKIIGLPADILLADTSTRLADAVESEFGGKLHIMVNNATYDEIRPVGQLDADYVGKILTGNGMFKPWSCRSSCSSREAFSNPTRGSSTFPPR